MSDEIQPVIRLKNVSKRFTYSRDQPQSVLESAISVFQRKGRKEKRDLWAVQDLSFDVYPGQSLGIIGRNGSGKSTVLKLIARILRPTKGQVMVAGRVSALLELGAGFHTDLTGRENIALNASVLGLTQKDVEENFDSIAEFSELGEFIDMPVKHYSSGMYMRLGFSVAIHVDPDILIIDEILAVGDQSFQTKCIDRIHELKRQGVTIILISHNLDIIRRICSRVIWLEHGRMRASGLTEDVADAYKDYADQSVSQQLAQEKQTGSFRRWGTREIEIRNVRFLDAFGREKNLFKSGEEMIIEIDYLAHKPVNNPEFGLAIYRHDGTHINGPNSLLGGLDLGEVEGHGIVCYHIHQLPLLPARYQVTAAIHDSRLPLAYDYHEQAYPFRVTRGESKETEGLIAFPATWEYRPSDQ